MQNDATRIEEPVIERNAEGAITRVSLVFGPHYFVDVFLENGKVQCSLGATHHGIKADATQVNGQLEQFVNELAAKHPENSF